MIVDLYFLTFLTLGVWFCSLKDAEKLCVNAYCFLQTVIEKLVKEIMSSKISYFANVLGFESSTNCVSAVLEVGSSLVAGLCVTMATVPLLV